LTQQSKSFVMKITRLKIENFRSVRSLELNLGDTTIFIGQNNAGKSAILEAVRIVLTRRWGQRGTGFTEHDVHKPGEMGDPRTLPPVTVTLFMEEPSIGAWESCSLSRFFGWCARALYPLARGCRRIWRGEGSLRRRAACSTCSGRLGGAAAAGRTMVRSPAAPSPIPL
jgi:hypothetical protein